MYPATTVIGVLNSCTARERSLGQRASVDACVISTFCRKEPLVGSSGLWPVLSN